MTREEIIKAITAMAMQQYEGRRLMGESPLTAFSQVVPFTEALLRDIEVNVTQAVLDNYASDCAAIMRAEEVAQGGSR
jgi:hypothetical protein